MKGKTTISVAIVSMGLGFLSFLYFESKGIVSEVHAISERVTRVETLQPGLVERLDRIETKIDNLK